jgi:hypothetical protein
VQDDIAVWSKQLLPSCSEITILPFAVLQTKTVYDQGRLHDNHSGVTSVDIVTMHIYYYNFQHCLSMQDECAVCSVEYFPDDGPDPASSRLLFRAPLEHRMEYSATRQATSHQKPLSRCVICACVYCFEAQPN